MTFSTFNQSSHKAALKSGEKKLRTSTLKSRGMKGRAPNAYEKALHNKMAALGCIACLLDGRHNTHVSIHHIDGRTKEDAHRKVLPLCAQHHQQDDTDPLGRIAVHPNKARFEDLYGSQYELLGRVMERIGE